MFMTQVITFSKGVHLGRCYGQFSAEQLVNRKCTVPACCQLLLQLQYGGTHLLNLLLTAGQGTLQPQLLLPAHTAQRTTARSKSRPVKHHVVLA